MDLRIDGLVGVLGVGVLDEGEGDVLALLLDVHAVDRAELFELVAQFELGGLESTKGLHRGSGLKCRSSCWFGFAQRFCREIWSVTLTTCLLLCPTLLVRL